jgi:hypothetical protein
MASTVKYVNQTWALLLVNYVHQVYGDTEIVSKYINQFYWDYPSVTRYVHQDYGDYDTSIMYLEQIYSLMGDIRKHYNQTYALTGDIASRFWNQLWDLEGYDFVQTAIHQMYSLVPTPQTNPTVTDPVPVSTGGTYDSTTYPVVVTSGNTVTDTWTITFTDPTNYTVAGTITGSVGTGNISTNLTPTNPVTGQPYFALDADGWGGVWVAGEQLIFDTAIGNVTIVTSITIDGQPVFSPSINIDLDEDRATIDASISITNPAYFSLCKRNNPVVISINATQYHFIIREISTASGVHVDTYALKCQSPVAILQSNSTPLLQKEFESDLASNIVQELADIAGLTVDWQVYHNGQLVDWTIPPGLLFANNEKPLAVMRKITEACGAKIQSKPDGNLEIMHEFPVRVPDWSTATPAYIINNLVRFRSMSSVDQEKSGANTVYVSDQTTAEKTWQLEEEEVSATKKRVLGWHTPWDTTEVVLSHTSTDADVEIVYIGVEEPDYPITPDDEGEDVDPEIIEIVDGEGSVSRPIYEIVTSSYETHDNLGSITFSEDGKITTEIKNETVLSIRYKTKYHVWEVTSPNVNDVQCVLDWV